jgi:hypothetical protein
MHDMCTQEAAWYYSLHAAWEIKIRKADPCIPMSCYTKEVQQLESIHIFSFLFSREAMLEYKSARTDHGYFFKR